jgi:outer membrane protein insertion porin family
MKPLLVIKKEKEDLEKQVNNYRTKLSSILFLLVSISAFAQEFTPFGNAKNYILGGIDVTGKFSYNPQTIITFTELEVGQNIMVPSEDIGVAIKKLGKLNYFSDIDLYETRTSGDTIWLELKLMELPKLNKVDVYGLKKGKREDLIKDNKLRKGTIVNENFITTTKNSIEGKYKKDGFYKARAIIDIEQDTADVNLVNMTVRVDKGNKIKIKDIEITGNKEIKSGKLRGAMSNTKRQFFGRFWKSSKYIRNEYEEDLKSLVDKYKENGFRDARIISDSVIYNKDANNIVVKLNVEEGRKYYFGNIKFIGNSVYKTEDLTRMVGINKGDTYNGVLLQKRISDKKKPDGDDITNLYQNNGYLFSNINAVETRTENDTIDFEIRVVEGPVAYFNKINVVGNDKTNDHVIYRELRTKPGQKYSKDDLVRSVRELGQLGFFDPETIDPKFKNVDPTSGTLDIEYNLVEKGSSQIELQGGYGGGGFIGTLGLSFNNFSIKNIFKKDAYKPLPMGDGQKLALRLQGSTFFQTYSFSFSEPWLGGKKPVNFSASISHSVQYLFDFQSRDVDRSKFFNITSLSFGLAKRLKWPDDYFVISHSVAFQYFQLNNYNTGLFTFGNGVSRNLSYTLALTRNSKGSNPIYPKYGSEFAISAKMSPPYSLFNGVDYAGLETDIAYKYKSTTSYPGKDGRVVNIGDYVEAIPSPQNPDPSKVDINHPEFGTKAASDRSLIDQKKFAWQEFFKVKVKMDNYATLFKDLVLRVNGEFGFLGAYNSDRGVIPFERFFVGGDGLANFAMDGREIVQLRGYPNQALSTQDGGAIYNKFTMELRYPLTLKPQASIYALTFMEAGGSYDKFQNFNPFKMSRSAGVGLRVFMPAFGLLGIDFAHGFDPLPGQIQKNGWETHFIIGQQF